MNRFVCSLLFFGFVQVEAKKPNIVFFLVDDLRVSLRR